MELEPRHAEDDWVQPESRDVEANGLGVRTNVKRNERRFVSDGAGRDGTAIGKMHEKRGVLEGKIDGVRSNESGIDE